MHEPGKRRFRFWRFRRRRVRYVAILPTLLTIGNGVCGFLALLEIGKGLFSIGPDRDPAQPLPPAALAHFHWAGFLILVAMVFDALDGKVARATNTSTSFGAQMDSLCDLVTFGIAPGFLVYALNTVPGSPLPERVVLVVSVFYAMCTLLRLARFTVETTPDDASHQSFSGLPSPAAAGAVASAVISRGTFPEWPAVNDALNGISTALPFIAFVLGVLMVSRIRYAHLVNQLFRGFRPFVRLVELAMFALLAVIFHEVAFFLGFAAYVLSGPLLWAWSRMFRKPVPTTPAETSETGHDTSFF